MISVGEALKLLLGGHEAPPLVPCQIAFVISERSHGVVTLHRVFLNEVKAYAYASQLRIRIRDRKVRTRVEIDTVELEQ